MSRREQLVDVIAIGLVALLVRLWAAALIVFPMPEDTAYYVGAARNLLAGRGLVTDALWSYGTAPLEVPRPAFELWAPLPSLLAAGPMAVFGPTFAAAQLVATFAGVALALLAWRLAADFARERNLPESRARMLALGAGLATAVYLPLVLHSALPDSTMLFGVFALGAGLLMTRLVRRPAAGLLRDPRLWTLGALLGLAALTRSEAIWLALAWALLVVRAASPWPTRARLLLVPAAVALAFYAPWMAREFAAFGTPFPGQAIANTLWLDRHDIAAWAQQPNLARLLAAGPGSFLTLRLEAFYHNLVDVLVLPGMPLTLAALAGLPLLARSVALRPALIMSGLLFFSTILLFPVATTAGTFLHDAVIVHVVLLIAALAGLDALIARLAQRRAWTRPTAWLAPFGALVAGLGLTLVLLPLFGAETASARARYAALPDVFTQIGVPADAVVVSDSPVWLAWSTGRRAVVLPHEELGSVLDLARHFDAHFIVFATANGETFLAELAHDAAGADCFAQIPFALPADTAGGSALADTQIWRRTCP